MKRNSSLFRLIKKSHEIFNQLTSFFRECPDFLVIGSARCGKTSLYNYLLQSPYIFNNFRNETSFFDINFCKGLNWYQSNFPTTISKAFSNFIFKKKGLVGEIVHIHSPLVPKRLMETIPHPKIIVILRNPTDRAYAHYLMSRRLGDEGVISFEEALGLEESRINSEHTNDFSVHKRQWFLYKTNGMYIDMLEEWWKYFPKENMLILKFEDLIKDKKVTVNKALEFLGLPHLSGIKCLKNFHDRHMPKIEPKIKENLINFFRPYNEKLYKQLGIDLEWEKQK